MKKYKSIGKLLAVSFFTAVIASACTEDAMDKVNKNPNNPQDAPAKFLITDLGVSTAFSTVGGDFSLYSSVYMEHETGIGNQLYRAEVRSGEPTTATTYNNAWISVYANIKNAKIVINKCQEDPSEKGNVVTEAIARILLAYNGAVVADVFGDTPFSETGVLNPDGTPKYMQPKIDSQESIYKEVMQNLNAAITLLKDGTAEDEGLSGAVGSKDLIYGSDQDAQAGLWLKTAYALKARYTMRLLNKSANQTTDLQNILTYVSKSFTNANEECKLDIYDGDSQLNPLWAFSYSRNSLAASESLIEKFATRNDPRAPRSFIQPDPSGNVVYGGGANQATTIDAINVAPNGTPQELQNNYGMSMASWAMTAPTQLISYHEVKFLEAEALCRLGGRVDEAKAALKDAVIAAFANLENTVADAARNWLGGKADFLGDAVAEAYFDNEVAPLFAANPLKETMVQKYLAFFGASGESLEAYNDYRRMKGANENLVELKNPLNSNKFPLRFGYGADDVLANVAIKEAFGDGQYVYSEPVWWAGGSR